MQKKIKTYQSFSEISLNKNKKTIIIVGLGFAGAYFLSKNIDLIIKSKLMNSVQYIIIDPKTIEQYGCGIAWGTNQPNELRANMYNPIEELVKYDQTFSKLYHEIRDEPFVNVIK